MKHTELQVRSADGTALYAQEWQPELPLRGVVCTLHGLGEHGGQYEMFSQVLGESGFAVTAPDHRGHGRSEGKRGHTPSYRMLLDDVDAFVRDISARHPGLPRFLYGHSLGGNIALNYAIRRAPEIAGVIATCPWLRLVREPGLFKRLAVRMIDPIAPWLTFSTSSTPDDPEERDERGLDSGGAAAEDTLRAKLFHKQVSVRMYVGASRAASWALANAGRLAVPALVVHGELDPVTDPRASMEFAGRANGSCEIDVRPGMQHSVQAEEYGPQVAASIAEWLSSRTPRLAPLYSPETLVKGRVSA